MLASLATATSANAFWDDINPFSEDKESTESAIAETGSKEKPNYDSELKEVANIASYGNVDDFLDIPLPLLAGTDFYLADGQILEVHERVSQTTLEDGTFDLYLNSYGEYFQLQSTNYRCWAAVSAMMINCDSGSLLYSQDDLVSQFAPDVISEEDEALGYREILMALNPDLAEYIRNEKLLTRRAILIKSSIEGFSIEHGIALYQEFVGDFMTTDEMLITLQTGNALVAGLTFDGVPHSAQTAQPENTEAVEAIEVTQTEKAPDVAPASPVASSTPAPGDSDYGYGHVVLITGVRYGEVDQEVYDDFTEDAMEVLDMAMDFFKGEKNYSLDTRYAIHTVYYIDPSKQETAQTPMKMSGEEFIERVDFLTSKEHSKRMVDRLVERSQNMKAAQANATASTNTEKDSNPLGSLINSLW